MVVQAKGNESTPKLLMTTAAHPLERLVMMEVNLQLLDSPGLLLVKLAVVDLAATLRCCAVICVRFDVTGGQDHLQTIRVQQGGTDVVDL